jgi:hypothetical protein
MASQRLVCTQDGKDVEDGLDAQREGDVETDRVERAAAEGDGLGEGM